MELVRQRYSTKEIAARLGIAPDTIDKHVASACRKLGVGGRAGLERLPFRGSFDPPDFQGAGESGVPTPKAIAAVSTAGTGSGHGQTITPVRVFGGDGSSGSRRADAKAEIPFGLGSEVAGAGMVDIAAERVSRRIPDDGVPGGRLPLGRGMWGAPGPFQRLGWVMIVAAAAALLVGALIGAYDLIMAFQRIPHP